MVVQVALNMGRYIDGARFCKNGIEIRNLEDHERREFTIYKRIHNLLPE
jgi:hypothetical protein